MSHSPLFRSHSMCDFCDARPIEKIYDAAPRVTGFAGERILFPDTKWSACASCATLIDQCRWGELTDRCAKIWIKDMSRCSSGARPARGKRRYLHIRSHVRI